MLTDYSEPCRDLPDELQQQKCNLDEAPLSLPLNKGSKSAIRTKAHRIVLLLRRKRSIENEFDRVVDQGALRALPPFPCPRSLALPFLSLRLVAS